MRDRECLNCENYRPEPPANWKPAWGEQYDIFDLHRHLGTEIRCWEHGWPGKCVLQPTPVNIRSVDVCGQWTVNVSFLLDWRNLRELRHLRGEINELRAELKAVKQLSLDRYRRLKKTTNKRSARAEARGSAIAAERGE